MLGSAARVNATRRCNRVNVMKTIQAVCFYGDEKREEEEESDVGERREPSLLVGDGEIRDGLGGKMAIGDEEAEAWKAVTRLVLIANASARSVLCCAAIGLPTSVCLVYVEAFLSSHSIVSGRQKSATARP